MTAQSGTPRTPPANAQASDAAGMGKLAAELTAGGYQAHPRTLTGKLPCLTRALHAADSGPQ
jgi:hypothetical protein